MARTQYSYGTTSPSQTFSGPVTLAEGGGRGLAIGTRSVVSNFPVPTFRPTSVNTTIALDIMPNGTPSENAGNGVAWVDVCNADVKDNNNPVACGRVGALYASVFFGSVSFNGHASIPMRMGVDSLSWEIDTNNVFRPYVDNSKSLGDATHRPTAVYSVAGTLNTSDRRQKKHIKALTLGLDFVMQLRPVEFRWKKSSDDGGLKHYGFIAQEVLPILPDGAAMVRDGEIMSMASHELIAPLVKAVQELSREVDRLRSR